MTYAKRKVLIRFAFLFDPLLKACDQTKPMEKQTRLLLALVGVVTFLVSFLATTALASQSFGGTMTRIGDQLFLTTTTNPVHMVRATSDREDVNNTLKRLGNGDSIVGTATFDGSGRWVKIESIDFVGLRRLIGLWNTTNTTGLMNFRSYQDLNVIMLGPQGDGPGLVTTKKEFKYTITPAIGDDWVLFLSDDRETQMGLMDLKDGSARITLLNPQTGNVAHVIELQKF